MGLSLRGATSGAIDINPPAVAGDNTITLPSNNGSANQFFRNSGTAGIVTYSSMVETDTGVGIGTDNPSELLHLASDSPMSLLLNRGGGNPSQCIFKNSGNLLTISNNKNGIHFDVGSSSLATAMYIEDGGNIGIGTDNPAVALHVIGDITMEDNSPRLEMHDANAADNLACTGGIELFDSAGNRGAYMGATEGSGFLSFGISPTAGAAPTERLRITSDGNTLIPGNQTTSSETGKLDIYHTSPDSINSPHIRLWGAANNDARIEFGSPSNTGEGGYIMYNDGDEGLYIGSRMQDQADVNICTGMNDGSPTSNVRLRVTSAGKVFIGSPSDHGPSAYNLANTGLSITAAGENVLRVLDSTSYAADVGGAILMGGNYRTSGDTQPFVELKSFKENATDANYAYGFRIGTSANGQGITERLRITSTGEVKITNTGSSNGSTVSQLTLYTDNSGSNDNFTQRIAFKRANSAGMIYTAIDSIRTGTYNTDTVIKCNDGGALGEKIRILSTGGITFNGDTATTNALNDYEEGTWTPTLGGNASYDIQVGTYTKIGNLVYAYCRIRPTSLGTGSDDTISGLPFNPNNSDSGVMIGYYDGSAVSSVELGGVLNSNGSIGLYTKTSAANHTGTTTFFQDNCRIYLSTVYQTDS